MLTPAQLKKIWLLSDTVLYPEAVAFMQKHVQGSQALPNSQVTGLFNAAASVQYPALYQFITHQRDRNWPYAKLHLKKFYTSLEETLTRLHNTRLRNEFHLLEDVPGRSVSETREEVNELMALLACEFIQHVLAENGVLLQSEEEQRRQGTRGGEGGSRQQGQQGRQGQPGARPQGQQGQPGQQRTTGGAGTRPQGQPQQNNRRQP
ncbi:MAG: hypothetical protein ACR2H5_22010 [Ktedonobacteraceae bacterium]